MTEIDVSALNAFIARQLDQLRWQGSLQAYQELFSNQLEEAFEYVLDVLRKRQIQTHALDVLYHRLSLQARGIGVPALDRVLSLYVLGKNMQGVVSEIASPGVALRFDQQWDGTTLSITHADFSQPIWESGSLKSSYWSLGQLQPFAEAQVQKAFDAWRDADAAWERGSAIQKTLRKMDIGDVDVPNLGRPRRG